jgi:hypothetical protein
MVADGRVCDAAPAAAAATAAAALQVWFHECRRELQCKGLLLS